MTLDVPGIFDSTRRPHPSGPHGVALVRIRSVIMPVIIKDHNKIIHYFLVAHRLHYKSLQAQLDDECRISVRKYAGTA